VTGEPISKLVAALPPEHKCVPISVTEDLQAV
jgi:hypothetical protein